MKPRYRSASISAILRVLGLGAIFATVSLAPGLQLIVKKGFNDPATLVDHEMHLMPRSLNLTPQQRREMRRIYIDLSKNEQRIAFEPGPTMLKRGKVRVLAQQSEQKIRALLSPKQYAALKKWERTTHKPVIHVRRPIR